MKDLTDMERMIWASAYGAAFAHEFHRIWMAVEWDDAVKRDYVEDARGIADLAVQQYRDGRGLSFAAGKMEEP